MTAWQPWQPPPLPADLVHQARRRGGSRVFAVLAAVGLLLFVGGSAGGVALSRQPGTVVLEVTGPGTAHITWYVGTDMDQDLEAVLPWRLETRAGQVTVNAQLLGTGEIACRAGPKEHRASGEYAYVSCTG